MIDRDDVSQSAVVDVAVTVVAARDDPVADREALVGDRDAIGAERPFLNQRTSRSLVQHRAARVVARDHYGLSEARPPLVHGFSRQEANSAPRLLARAR
ncbi:MAG: hypothetical protein JO262_04870 [Solirubrobacterales bacterium]|nr:hypothetical protein [Solirubrobacterales bacterium]